MNKLLLCAVALTSIFLLGGCSDDDASTELPGTWQATKLAFTDATGTQTQSTLPPSWSETLVLNLDGTFSYASTQAGQTRTGNGFWGETADGLVLTEQRESTRAYRFDGNTLVLSGGIPEGTYDLYWEKTAQAQ